MIAPLHVSYNAHGNVVFTLLCHKCSNHTRGKQNQVHFHPTITQPLILAYLKFFLFTVNKK